MMQNTVCFEDAFRYDCIEVDRLLVDSGSRRLRELMWCGRPIREICEAPDRYLASVYQDNGRPRMSHGFIHTLQPATFEGAFSHRGSKWFLPSLKSSAFPSIRSDLASLVARNGKRLQNDFERVRGLLSPHPDHDEVVESGNWDAFILFGPKGVHPALHNGLNLWCSHLLQHAEFCSSFGFCMFLSMGGDSALIPHVGSTNLRLRCHLTLRAPQGRDAVLTVDGRCVPWKEGEIIIFDDSYEHSARNTDSTDRVVFSVDLWHPALSPQEIAVLSSEVFSRFAKVRVEP